MTPLYLVGLDLGQLSDYSALVIAERTLVQYGPIQEQHYYVRHLERWPLGTPYGGRCLHGVAPQQPCRACPQGRSIGGIVEQLRGRLLHLPVPEAWYRAVPVSMGRVVEFPRADPVYDLVLDATGVGRGVAEMFRSADVWPVCVTITAGTAVTAPDRHEWHVAKRQLISPFQVVLQTRRLHVVNNDLGRILMQEGVTFQYKLHPLTGDEQYGAWRQNQHDDLLLACAMVCWYGERFPMVPDTQPEQRYATASGHPLFPHEVPHA